MSRRWLRGVHRRGPGRILTFDALEVRAVPATITVMNTNDSGLGSLRDAIAQANTDPTQDTIDFAPAVTGTITLLSALPDLSGNIVLTGPGATALTVARSAAAGTADFSIFTVTSGFEVTISGLTITGGQAVNGGGIINEGTLTVLNSTLSGNSAGGIGDNGQGGGIMNAGMMTITSSTIIDNLTYVGNGGGIGNSGTLTIADSTVSDNTIDSAEGGGISNSGTVAITDSTVSGNSAGGSKGAGIFNSNSMTITDSTVSDNLASFDNSGGIVNSGTLTITDSTVSGNSAQYSFGGINNSGVLTISGSTLDGNVAGGAGGGISNAGTLSMTDSTVSDNSAQSGYFGRTFIPGVGGGIWNSGTATIADCTLSGNTAVDDGGGVYLGGSSTAAIASLTVIGSLFANPTGGNLVDAGYSEFVSQGHNLFSDIPAVALNPTDLVDTNPLLGPLADNGGPTLTCALLPGSPALDAGVAVPGVTTDQRGVPRTQGSAPDIGAFESRGFTLDVISGNYQSTLAGATFAVPLVVTVASPYGEPVIGGQVTFVSPPTGADFTGNPATIGPNGQASVAATAAGGVGTYTVTARTSAGAGAGGASFSLRNIVQNPSIALTPPTGSDQAGQPCLVTATLRNGNGTPLAGLSVTFLLVAGPNIGTTGVITPAGGLTDVNGQVNFAYEGRGGVGTDTIVATAVIPGGVSLLSLSAMVVWTPAPPAVIGKSRIFAGQSCQRKVVGFRIKFNLPLDAATTRGMRHYRVTQPGLNRHSPPVVVRVRAARYNRKDDSLSFILGEFNPEKPLTLTATGLVGASGVPVPEFSTRL